LSGPIGGVAICDVNGDGLLDLIATSAAGDRIFSQRGKVTFKDTTEAFGLKTKSHSVSVADANGDGAPDLLLDGVLYLQKEQKFIATESVPKQNEVISAAFVEIDGDGFPDIVVSRKNGGLAVFANDKKGSGYFEAGDWDGNGRTDLIYLTGSGLILRNEKERFTATQIGKEGEEYQWTTAAMAPLIHPNRSAAFVAHADGKFLIENDRGEVADITHYGNEIQDDITGMFDAVAEDITADGTLDIFAGTRAQGATSFYVMNRGYGSFMLPEKYAPGLMPREVFNHASGGIAVGDINGDGANDLVTGGADGQLWMVQNETLTNRKPAAEEATLGDERKQIEARIVTVSVEGKTGVLGAKLALISADGHLVAARQIGSNIGIGCSGPARVIFTVREPGAYKLGVTFSDGTTVSQPVDLSATQPRHQKITVRKATEP